MKSLFRICVWMLVAGIGVGTVASMAQVGGKLPTASPEELARESFHMKDYAYVRVPICVDSVPLDRGTKKVLGPQKVLATCKMIANDRTSEAEKWEAFARRYNNTMFDLRERNRKN